MRKRGVLKLGTELLAELLNLKQHNIAVEMVAQSADDIFAGHFQIVLVGDGLPDDTLTDLNPVPVLLQFNEDGTPHVEVMRPDEDVRPKPPPDSI